MKLTLSPRQAEIYEARKGGERNYAIARRLNLKKQTVSEHYARACEKLEQVARIAEQTVKGISR